MGKIGDLFVKLGLKNDEFKKGLAESKAEVNGFGSKFKGVATAIKGFWVAIGATAAKAMADIIKGTQRWGDAWAVTVSRAKAAWDSFVTGISNWDWEGFGQRVRNAMGAAGKSAAAHDAQFEVDNSIRIRKAAMREELANLQIIARSTDKSYEERAKAAKAYLDKVEPLYRAEEDLRKSLYINDTGEYLSRAGLAETADNRDLLTAFLTRIATNGDYMTALETWTKKNSGKKTGTLTAGMNAIIDQLAQEYGNAGVARLGVLANFYNGNNRSDELAKKATDAIEGWLAAQGAFADETKRMQVLQNSFGRQMEEPSEQAVAAIPEAAYQNAVEILRRVERIAEKTDAIWEDEKERYLASLEDVEGEIQPILDGIQEQIIEGLVPTEKDGFKLNNLIDGALTAAVDGFVDATQELFDALSGLEGVDGSAIAAALLTPLCETAKRMGEVMMTMALGEIAILDSIKNPYALLAAGAALVAIGAAGKAALSSAISGGTATTSTGTATDKYSSGVQTAELTVNVKGTIKGSDIIISGSNTMNEWAK